VDNTVDDLTSCLALEDRQPSPTLPVGDFKTQDPRLSIILTPSTSTSSLPTPTPPATSSNNSHDVQYTLPYTFCQPKAITCSDSSFGGPSYIKATNTWSKYHALNPENGKVEATALEDLQLLVARRSTVDSAVDAQQVRKYQPALQCLADLPAQAGNAAGKFGLAAGKIYIPIDRANNKFLTMSGFRLEKHFFVTCAHFLEDIDAASHDHVLKDLNDTIHAKVGISFFNRSAERRKSRQSTLVTLANC